MKKILFIISLLITYNIFSQTFNTETYYGDELCQTAQNALISKSSFVGSFKPNNTFSDENAYIALDKILFQIGASRDRFIIQSCSNINNALAVQLGGVRYILYDPNFIEEVANDVDNSSWGQMFILAHEVGHHINNHSLDLLIAEDLESETKHKQRQQELDADIFAAFVIARLGGDYEQIVSVIKTISDNENDQKSTHPNLDKRLKAVKVGYNRGVSNNSQNFYNPTNLQTAEEYFNRALLNELKGNYDKAIYDYTKAINIDPFYNNAIYRRGITKREKEDYFGSIKDLTKLSDIYNDMYKPYSEIGLNYYKIGDYNSAVSFLTISIEKKDKAIKSGDFNNFNEFDAENYHLTYYNRGQAYLKLRMYDEAYNDFSYVIYLQEGFDKAYSQISQIYILRKEYYQALSWINKAIEYNSTNSKNYFNRAVILDFLNQLYFSMDDYDDSWNQKDKIEYLKNSFNLKILEIENYNLAIKYNKNYAIAYRSRGIGDEFIADRISSNDEFLNFYLEISDEFKTFYNYSVKNNNESAYSFYNISACNDWSIAASLGNVESEKWISEDCN